MDETLKALLLLCGANLGAKQWVAFLKTNLPLRAIWEAKRDELCEGIFTDSARARFKKLEGSSWAEREYDTCLKRGIRLIAYGSELYPVCLLDLADPPAVLYWDGEAGPFASRSVGVVGTRKASAYGAGVAKSIGVECARNGIVLISGGALGIDCAAHSGALLAGGVTFAVFGTGIDVLFPQQNQMLFDEIRHSGALISEFPMGTNGEAWRFPRRNRIVAALSERLVVAEAPMKSGAMITARCALDLGREVWAVPGHITDGAAEGSNRLIFDGACPYVGHEPFFGLDNYGGPVSKCEGVGMTELFANLSPGEASVVSALRCSGGKTVDNIALEVKMSAADVLKTIAVLGAKGLVCSSGPGRYSAKV